MKLKNLNLLILSRCRLESHQVEGICWDRLQDVLYPGSDINDLPWPWDQPGPGRDISLATLFIKLASIYTYNHSNTFCHRQVYCQCFSPHSHIYYISYKTDDYWDLGKPIMMKHYHTSSSSSPPSNSCRRREIFGPAVGQILRLCWLFRGRGLAGLEVVRL